MPYTPEDKLMDMKEAIGRFVRNGDRVYLGGFIHCEPYAAAHEIIRQKKRDLTISTAAATILVDQLIGAGCVARLITSYCWNPVPEAAHAFRRAVEKGEPRALELEEYSFLGISLAYFAGALKLPFVATHTMLGSGYLEHPGFMGDAKAKVVESPFDGEKVCLIPPLRHDVGIVQVQRADPKGNAQAWGMLGPTRYGLLSCERVIICAEEIVHEDAIRGDPNRTILPAFRCCAVVEEPWGAHPAYVQGCYDRDWRFASLYSRMTKSPGGFQAFLEEWVLAVRDRKEYIRRLGEERLTSLISKGAQSGTVTYGYHDIF
jgi:glutaconate CoA-transferase subunit A